VFPEGFCALFAPAAALPAWLLTPLLPKPVVEPVVVPGLPPGFAVLPVVAPAVPPVPPPALPPAPPAPLCAKAAALENIKAVAKPIVVSFMNYSDCLLAMGDKRMRAILVPSIRSGRVIASFMASASLRCGCDARMQETEPGSESEKKLPKRLALFRS
jgi:hypothetical protein